MANSPTSIETQIDSFLEQFKRSASKAMEERMEWPDGPSPGAVVKSRSSCFALDSASAKFKLPHVQFVGRRRYGNVMPSSA
ncbi:unnamed protein product [Colias eurytheme]|nr:unnamed protein product [Colias eurytheme]